MTENTMSMSEAAATAAAFVNNTGRHVFLTGKAGTGKTTFLRHIVRKTHKSAIIAAPTGIAAINAGGVTLHSLFQLPFGAFVPVNANPATFGNVNINTPETLVRHMQMNRNKRRLIQEIELLIIDEVSMLRADLLDAVDLVLRIVRRQANVPFGGVQVLFIGDLLQLPPVVKEEEWRVLNNYYKSPYFFDAQCLRNNGPLYIELQTIYRQSDGHFIDILNNLRHNRLEQEDIEVLNNYYKPGFKQGPENNHIFLTTHNYKADNINRERLEKLSGRSFIYKAEIKGEFSEYSFPVEMELELKKGAQVMFTKNDLNTEKRFFNGKIGKVKSLGPDSIEVEFEDSSDTVFVEQHEWKNIRYKLNEATNEIGEQLMGSFKQYPLKLAWAITVHKSQGLTFEKAIIDLGGVFAPGQAYVALSRLTSLDGLVLTSPISYRLPEQDEALTSFSDNKLDDEDLQEELTQQTRTYLEDFTLKTFDFTNILKNLRRHIETYTKDEKKSVKQKYEGWAKELLQKTEEPKVVADKFQHQLRQISREGSLEQLHSRVKSAQGYFNPVFKELSQTVLNHIHEMQSEKGTKAYVSELMELETMYYKQLQQMNKAVALLQSAVNGTEFRKEELIDAKERAARISQVGDISEAPWKKWKQPGEKKPKAEKGSTFRESLRMYKEGKSVEEIAKERNLSVGTIENHLARMVTAGELDIHQFVSLEKIEKINRTAAGMEEMRLTPLKELLGDEYSYAEIRMALAYAEKGEG